MPPHMRRSRDQGVFPPFWKIVDVIEIECFSFLKQQIIRHIYFESNRLGLQPLSTAVVDAVVQYYCAGSPVWNFSLQTVVVRLALSIHLAPYQA